MTIDAHETVNLTESTQGSSLQPELADRHNIASRLDDAMIVRRFARGKKRLVVNQNLRIDYAHNSLQLSTPTGELIAIHKIAERLHYILVKKDSKYSKLIQEIISDCQFIPIDTATADRGFIRYQKYEIPAGYTLQYEATSVLWQTWQDDRQNTPTGLQLDILILARSKWYRVQQMICTDDRLDVQTRLGLISLSLRDRIAWIAKPGDVAATVDSGLNTDQLADLSTDQTLSNRATDSDILGKIISKLAIEVPGTRDLDFDPNSTMTQSGFHPPQHQSSLLYEEDRSSTLTANTLTPITQRLTASAIQVLEQYLEHGETIVRTELVVDAQGNTIGEKTITTQRGCPKWAIEAIIDWV
jgi:hypothetical protein